MSYGGGIEIIEPLSLRNELKNRFEMALGKYE